MPKKKREDKAGQLNNGFALDLNSGFPELEMLGNRRVTIEGSTGVLRYESENIKINTNKMVVSFVGRNLTVKCISVTCVVIEGFITSVEFIT